MTTISKEHKLVTLINVFTVEPANQQQLLELLVSATETSRVDGSCGRRPMTTTSKTSTDTVTTMVVHHTQVGTSTSSSRAFSCARRGARRQGTQL